jgi:hypothetical protein
MLPQKLEPILLAKILKPITSLVRVHPISEGLEPS